MYKPIVSILALFTACSSGPMPEPTGQADQALRSTTTKIRVNGRSANVLLFDTDGTNGFLTVTQDQVAATSGLDFSYATPDPGDPDFAILYQGAGVIPNSAYTQTATSAHLQYTTSGDYTVTRCVVNLITAEFTCAPSAPLSFDLTWTQDSFGSVHETTKRKETMGPVTTTMTAEFTTVTAQVSGTWGGHTSTGLTGELTDSESKTYIREIVTAF